MNEKKIGGLLIETIQCGQKYVICVGVGLNITSHPKALTKISTHLTSADGLGTNLSEEDWFSFLSHLKTQFSEALENSQKNLIVEKDREQLVEALNNNPTKTNVIIDISDQGDIHTESETIPWSEV